MVDGRPLHAAVLPQSAAGGRLLGLLAAALDGSGPAILPLDPDIAPARMRGIIEAFAPAAIETADGITPIRSAYPAARPVPVAGGTAVVIATSGSTGRPKGVELSAAALLHSARASLARIGAKHGERWLCCLPVTHIAGIQVLVRSLLSGTVPVIAEKLNGRVLAQSGCSHVSVVPTQLRRLLRAHVPAAGGEAGGAAGTPVTGGAAAGLAGAHAPGAPWASFRSVLLGGAAAPAGLVAAAREAGIPVVTTYGMSETCGGCVYDGVPLDGVSVATGDDGRIRIAGPVLFTGYRLQPGLTAAALSDGWFVTSDLGRLDASGVLTVRGRADDVINTGGEKVVAAEVASVLEDCPGVREAVVVGRPDPEWGERVTAVVVPADRSRPPGLEMLRQAVRARLPRYAAPRELVLLDALPMLASGKPDLEALRREQSPHGNVSK
ncbi:MAG TPA: AMP-binding protein [Streptosporangiaceae bacterium]|nr:AMP-binding protein [Streptosporangiaceae bacterium]